VAVVRCGWWRSGSRLMGAGQRHYSMSIGCIKLVRTSPGYHEQVLRGALRQFGHGL
jgi:hypothetical protein